MKLVAFLILISLPNLAYANTVSDASDDYCKCAKPSFDGIEEMKLAMNNGNMAALQQMAGKMQANTQELQACFSKLEGKYGEQINGDEAFKQKVQAEIDKKCPRPQIGLPGMPQQ